MISRKKRCPVCEAEYDPSNEDERKLHIDPDSEVIDADHNLAGSDEEARAELFDALMVAQLKALRLQADDNETAKHEEWLL